MKTQYIKKAFWEIVSTMDSSTLVCANSGASNLTAEYLNSYSTNEIDGFLGDWIEENVNVHDVGDIRVHDILVDPDYLIKYAAGEFVDAFARLLGDNTPAVEVDRVFNSCKMHFDNWGEFYLFARPWSNACADYYLIRADSEISAYEWLVDKFEADFAVDEEAVDEESAEYNSNGTPVNTDNLMLVGVISGGAK